MVDYYAYKFTVDVNGESITRQACTIGELPAELRQMACEDATVCIATRLLRPAVRPITPDVPVYVAFGMTPLDAEQSDYHAVLTLTGADLPLTYAMIERLRQHERLGV